VRTPPVKRAPLLGPLIPWLLLGSVLGLAVLLVASRPLPSNDYSIYVAMGRQMLAQGSLLEQDPFTYTQPGQTFIHASWAYTLLCTFSHQLTGYQGIRLLVVLSLAATLLGLFFLARRGGASGGAAATCVLYSWLLLLQNLGARGQTLVYPLFLLLVALLQRPLRPWLAGLAGLLLGWVWTQLHGSFPIAILYASAVMVGSAWSARSWRAGLPAACALLGLVLGSSLGPYGPEIWVYVYLNGELPRHRDIVEWYPPSLRSFEGARFYGALAIWAGLLLWRRGVLRGSDWLLLLGFGLLGTTATRIVAWFGLATALPLARQLSTATEAPARLDRRHLLLLGLAAAFWLAMLGEGVPRQVELAPDTPVALAEALAAEAPSGRVFAPMEACGYLAWRFHEPSSSADAPMGRMPWPYFLDMRVWIYSDEVWDEFMSVSRAEPGWEQALAARQVSHLLLSHSFHGAGLLPAARSAPGWELVAEDAAGALFRRRSTP